MTFLLNSCSKEGCGRTVNSKDKISDEARSKIAYSGTEILTFLEIDNGDSMELVFKPVEHYDSTTNSYSYYEAPNGDQCIGYKTSTDVIYREYYCKERSWQFVCGMAATKEQLVLRFEELPRKKEDKYNFEIYFISDAINNPELDSLWGSVFIGEMNNINGVNNGVTKIGLDNTESVFYDISNGLVSWEFYDKGYFMKLKHIEK